MAAKKRRKGPYAIARPQAARKTFFNVRLKEEVLAFLKVGGDYHGVGFQTYLQWLLERALLDEIYYYGWDTLRPVGFDRQLPVKEQPRREWIHLDRVARSRALKDEKNGAAKK